MMLSDYQVEKANKEDLNLVEYLNQQKDEGKLNNVIDNNGIIEVTTRGYVVKINQNELSIIEISNSEMDLTAKYEITGYNKETNKIKILIIIKSNTDINEIICENEDSIKIAQEGKKEVGIDLEVNDGEKYDFIVNSNGINEVCSIQTKGMTVNDSSEIRNLEEFKEFQALVNFGYNFQNKRVKLKNNLDLSTICYNVDGTVTNDVSWIPIGNEINQFNGIFDGEGHTISNLYINAEDGNKGLFGYASNGEILNLTINGEINISRK